MNHYFGRKQNFQSNPNNITALMLTLMQREMHSTSMVIKLILSKITNVDVNTMSYLASTTIHVFMSY